MLVALLIGVGIGALAALVVHLISITFKVIVERFKKKRGTTMTVEHAKPLLAAAIETARNQRHEQDVMTIEQLEEMLGMKGCIEYSEDANGKVNPDDISLLSSDKMDADLEAYLNEHNGKLTVAA